MILTIDPPNDRQREFFLAKTRFIAYGGARGGGKSWAVRKKAQLLALNYPGIRMLIMRRTFPELRENHILPLMADLFGIAEYKETEKAFTFPNGSRLRFGYCDNDKDVLQYQGQEYDVIFLDEATQFSEYQFITLTACMRGTNGFPKRMYMTCNPGGVGHEWVKRLFINREYRGNEQPSDYTFIPARVYDNTVLIENDPGYVSMLENLPDDLKRAWLNGDWDVFAGQFFREFNRDTHTISPVPIPGHWRRYVTIDYGLDMFAALFIAVDEQKHAYVYREIYKPDMLISEAAEALKDAIGADRVVILAPPDLWNRRQETGKSVADIFMEHGIPLTKTSNDRTDGWMAVKEWLKPYTDEQGITRADLRIFHNCVNLIRTLPALQHDQRDPNDVAGQPHELTHAPDALRGFCVYWVQASKGIAPPPAKVNFFAERRRVEPLGKGERVKIV